MGFRESFKRKKPKPMEFYIYIFAGGMNLNSWNLEDELKGTLHLAVVDVFAGSLLMIEILEM